MKHPTFARIRIIFTFAAIGLVTAGYWVSSGSASSQSRPSVGPLRYRIYDMGVVQAGDTASQGFGISATGIAVGRSFRPGNAGAQAFSWTRGGGIVGLPNLAGRSFEVANASTNLGIIVGTAATTSFGSGRLPVVWQNGNVSQLPLPAGQTLGDAYGVRDNGIAVGSVDAGTNQRAVIYDGANTRIITQTSPGGCFFVTAFGIGGNTVVGIGWDPANAARNVGMYHDISTGISYEVGALPGANGAINFGVSQNGSYIVGSSMMNQGSGLPFIYTRSTGMMTAIPLVPGTTQGSARGVNSAGWVVGNDSGAFSVPFLYDGTASYRLQDLLPANSGWDLSANTSSSALGISEDNFIVGTGVHNGETHGYYMVPAQKTFFDYDGDGRADVSVFRPTSGTWYLQQSGSGFAAANWGVASDKIVPADYDGDGRTDIAVYRPSEGNWYVLRSLTGTLLALNFGVSEDLPQPADFDGDGQTDVAVYRPSTGTWWIMRTTGGLISARFGTSEDKPVAGDYVYGDGRADLAVFRPSNGTWYLASDLVDPAHNFFAVPFGISTDLVTPADFDGDGQCDVAVYRPSEGTWYWVNSKDGSFSAFQFGTSEDIPAAADFDGNGGADISVFRPSTGVWYRLDYANGGFIAVQFGSNGDRPTPAAFSY